MTNHGFVSALHSSFPPKSFSAVIMRMSRSGPKSSLRNPVTDVTSGSRHTFVHGRRAYDHSVDTARLYAATSASFSHSVSLDRAISMRNAPRTMSDHGSFPHLANLSSIFVAAFIVR
ncbi:hypothetical protein H310_04647 [Aphanomyces invadans]|uniref:Uncharacterized protein n=1 Tax=Aphanomyces invadans TaxID=157072 RepID=A0A024UDL0_9STRA|nr:hypothetical protein H310_04647 [Aphanomyces invadans]ETW04354.1 hypothetical protein H310_04647 [Aphanomyces invadans]|eukprot:XP_008867310.1 hypothetical protein H310_04647 [Aphanomyces invadans]